MSSTKANGWFIGFDRSISDLYPWVHVPSNWRQAWLTRLSKDTNAYLMVF